MKNANRKEPPGLMLYTSSRTLFETLEPQHLKNLLLAIMDYVAEGTAPVLQSAEEQIAWAAMRDHVNWDMQRYEKKCLQNQYNRFLREAEKLMAREDCPDFEEWLELSEQGKRKSAEILTEAYERYIFLRNLPNTNTNTNTNINPIKKTKTDINPITKTGDPDADPRELARRLGVTSYI